MNDDYEESYQEYYNRMHAQIAELWSAYFDSVVGSKVDASIQRQMQGDNTEMPIFSATDVSEMIKMYSALFRESALE